MNKAWSSEIGDRQLKAVIRRRRISTGVRFLSTRFLSERFSGHGLPRTVGDYHSLRRFCWFILTLIFTGVMIWQCVNVIEEFFTYPKITNIEVNEVRRPAFPAVTICNQNSLDTDKIKKWQKTQNLDSGKNISSSLLIKLLRLDESIREAERRNMSCAVAYDAVNCTMLGTDKNCFSKADEKKKREVNQEDAGGSADPPTENNNTDSGQDDSDSYYDFEDNYEDYYGEELNYYDTLKHIYDNYDVPDFGDTEQTDVLALLMKTSTSDLSDFRSWITIPESVLNSFGYRLPELVKTCTFNERNCDLKKDFYKFTTSKHGNCFTFNSKLNKRAPVKHTSKYGSENGLKITLSTKSNSYLNFLSPEVGFRVVVHDHSVIPFPEDAGVDVPPGTKTSLAVAMTKFRRLGKPHGDCSSNKWKYAGDYNVFGCRKLCLDERIMKECDCKTMVVNLRKDQKKQNEETLCRVTNKTEMSCRIKILREFNTVGSSQCSHCLPSCRETQYTTDFSTSKRNDEFQSARKMALSFRDVPKCLTESKDVNSDDFVDRDLVDVHVYIKSKHVQKIIEKKALTLGTLVSNIGGNFGLFLGLSLIAVMEIFEYILDLILYLLRVNRPEEEEEEEVMIEFSEDFGKV